MRAAGVDRPRARPYFYWSTVLEEGNPMEAASPARLYATAAGVVLTIGGIAGFFYSASFGSPGEVDEMLGIFAVNGWDNVVHLVAGLLGLVAAGYAARRYALAAGLFFGTLAIWGLIAGSGAAIAGALPGNTADNVAHLLLGLAGIAAAMATPRAGHEPGSPHP
jgi:hypothetical protein